MTNRRRPTLADVASNAGVSKMTASRALRGASDVSRASLDKVQAAAREVGYVGNNLALSLSSRRSNLIGVVVPGLTNIVFAEVLSGIVEGIRDSGLQPVFGTSGYDPETEQDVIRNMLSWAPAGLIVTGLDQPEQTRRLLDTADVPVVQIMDTDGDPVDACVGFSHREAGAAMAQTLLAAGRRRFGFVGHALGRDTRALKRLDGFTGVLLQGGLDLKASVTGDGPSTTGAGRNLTARLLADHPDLDCIYYANDDLAAGGAFHCLSAGIAVPGRVLLAGFNGLDLVASLPVPVATSVTPRWQIGAEAARIIIEARAGTRGPSAARLTFTPDIIAPA